MQAVQATRFGGPSVLGVVELPDPEPGPGEIAIDVTHAAVGLVDVFFRQGRYRDLPGMPRPPFVPGLEVAGTVRALGEGVSGLAVGEEVVSMSAAGVGGYASVYIAPVTRVASTRGSGIAPALAVAAVPNAAMAQVALTRAAHLAEGESVLVHGALGGFAAAFPGMARRLGASRVVGSVRAGRLAAARATRLPYDRVVDSAELAEALAGETFDVVVDPVGGAVRTRSLDVMAPGGRLLAVGNASGDWDHRLDSNELWRGSLTVSGFNSGAYLPRHPRYIRPALDAALAVVAAGQADGVLDVLPFSEAATAHERMEDRALDGRIVLTPDA
ncbi:zinc-binding alcohol dehydrogenase family protein [Streptomyces sp. NPDC050560]|uniref:zinc-binding alcohol dehydrogenase family protein n=1 Tax=Streptomyces sp. NPDC050560 TaxID=3365630 RepID=UPI0037A38179